MDQIEEGTLPTFITRSVPAHTMTIQPKIVRKISDSWKEPSLTACNAEEEFEYAEWYTYGDA